MATIAFMVGALVPAFLVSRLLLWISRSWAGGTPRLVVMHAFSWLIAAFIGGMGMADGGEFAGGRAAVLYIVPQLVWLTVDMFRYKRGTRQTVNTP